jgi:hypothetical protein
MSERYDEIPMSADVREGGMVMQHEGERRDLAAPLGEVARGQLEFTSGAANVILRVDAEMPELFRAHFDGVVPNVTVRDGGVRVSYPHFAPVNWIRYALASRRHAAEVTLNGSIPWRIAIRPGVARLDGDLGALRLEAFEIGGGASQIELRLPRPVGVVPIRISGGASHVTLRRPDGAAARVRVGGGAAKLAFDTQYFGAIGGHLQLESREYADTADRYEIEIGGGAASVTIDVR